MMELDEKDKRVMMALQEDATRSYREISRDLDCPVTTIFSRVKKLEDAGVIVGYKTVFDAAKVGLPTTAFLLASIRFRMPGAKELYDHRKVAAEVAKFPEVQEVHIIAGEWDFLIKIKVESVDAVGRFVMDKLRLIDGVENSLTCMVFETAKETTDLSL